MTEWWSLPGPASFVSQIKNSLDSGLHTIVALPLYAPQDLRETIISSRDHRLEILALSDRPASEQLYTFAGRSGNYRADLGLSDVSSLSELRGRILLLDDITEARWNKWRFVIQDIQFLTKDQPRLERCIFLAMVQYPLCRDLPTEQGGLSVIRCDNYCSKFDMMAYIHQKVSRRSLTRLERSLIIEIGSTLAMYDIDLADKLAEGTLAQVLDCSSILEQLASSRGWNENTAAEWESGTKMSVEGEPYPHSALPSMRVEVRARIWAALVSTVFVMIERRRREYLSWYRRKAGGNGLSDDMELPRIYELFKSLAATGQLRLSDGVLTRLSNLRSLRNTLAHYQIPALEQLSEAVLSRSTSSP